MRFEIARGGSGLTYEIRNIVLIAKKLQEYGVKIIWENIGDPVQKGEHIPDWMKEVLIDIIKQDGSYAYSHTKGVDATRTFIDERVY
jgi:alanine-synthesizing transaminase